jgi:hypothetical protein
LNLRKPPQGGFFGCLKVQGLAVQAWAVRVANADAAMRTDRFTVTEQTFRSPKADMPTMLREARAAVNSLVGKIYR